MGPGIRAAMTRTAFPKPKTPVSPGKHKPVIRWRWPQRDGNWTRNIFLPYAEAFHLVEDNECPEFCLVGGLQKENIWHYLGHRLFLSGENDRPDFEFFDWALSHAKRGPRNLRILPKMVSDPAIPSEVAHNQAASFVSDPVQCLQQKTKFCAFLFRNSACATRNQFFELLSRHRRVDAGGHVFRTGPKASPRFAAQHFLDASQFYRAYKFVIAFENSLMPGYTTEKLWLPLYAQSVPICWGNPRVADYFHPDSFINAFDFDNLESLVEHVLRVDADDELYLRYLSAPRQTAKQKAALHKDEKRAKAFFPAILHQVAAGSASVTQQRIFPREILSRLAPAAITKRLKLGRPSGRKRVHRISRHRIWPHRAFYDALHMPGDAVPEN